MEHWERFLGGLSEKVWQRFERRLDEGSRDGLAIIRVTAWRLFERRLGEDSRDGVAVCETAWRRFERRLGEGSREAAWRGFERDVFVPISIPRCKEKCFFQSHCKCGKMTLKTNVYRGKHTHVFNRKYKFSSFIESSSFRT